MRELAVQAFVTLDGVMQAPGGPEEDPSGGFTAGGWSVPYWDDVIEQSMGEAMGRPFDLVLGRKTYEIFAAYWPQAGDEDAELNDATKHVASTTLTELEWANSQLIEGEVAEGVASLREADGPELQVHGSANLIQTLLAADLVDEVRVLIYPVVVGPGKRLFGDGTIPRAFELTASKVSPSGVIIATFRRAGEVEVGTFAS
ncbi:MAG: riboflavin biosynthesis protein RibD [Solirubrobacterales bacterium]|jgi:dihydrofolate reductase|nr:riboflavin biosynthesis protein RibD [Solirubrobacterales bacterium]